MNVPSKRKESFAKIGTIYTISNIMVKGFTFLIAPIFARIMTKQEYGDFSGIAGWVSIIASIVTLDLYSSISIAKYDYNEKIDEYMSSALFLGNIATLICYIIVELNMSSATQFFKMPPLYLRIIFAYLIFYPAFQILLAKSRMYNEYKQVIGLTILNAIVSLGSQVVLVFVLKDKLFGRFLGNYGMIILFYSLVWFWIMLKGKKIKWIYCKHALKLALPLIPHVLSGIVLSSSDKIMIKNICGSEKNAIYSVAYTMAMIAAILLSSLNQAWDPWMYDRMKTHKDEIRRASIVYSIVFAFICIGIELFGPEAILLFGGNKYSEAKYLVPPVIFALMLQFVYTQYVNVEFYHKKNIGISVATVLAALINVSLNYLLLPRFGYQVAAYTTIAGYFFMVILHAFIVKVLLRKEVVFDIIIMYIATAIVLIMTVLTMIVYSYTLVRIIMIVIYFVTISIFIVFNRKGLRLLLKM